LYDSVSLPCLARWIRFTYTGKSRLGTHDGYTETKRSTGGWMEVRPPLSHDPRPIIRICL
jgi:hypothetical protein